jgi:hypothetical protein
MNLRFLASRGRNILINPVKAWDTIYSENKSLGYVTFNFFIPLLLLVAISAFFGAMLFTHAEFSRAYAVLAGIKYFIVMTLTIYATAYFLSEITKSSGTPAYFKVSFQIVLYSVVPLLLCQILSNLFESFIFVNVLALYGLYLFWTGVEKMLDPPQPKKIMFIILTFAAFIIFYTASNRLLTILSEELYFALFV